VLCVEHSIGDGGDARREKGVSLPNGRLTRTHDCARSEESTDEIREAERGGGCSRSGGNGKYE